MPRKHWSSIGIAVTFRLPHASKGKKRVGLLSLSDSHAPPQHCRTVGDARGVNLGFREFYLYGFEAPIQGRGANRVYVWAVLQ